MSEEQLRLLLRDAAELAPTALERDVRPRTRWLRPALAAAACVVAAAGVALWVSPGEPPRTGLPAEAPVVRTVAYRGLAVDVPSSWGEDQVRCGAPTADTVVYPGGASWSCATWDPPPYSSVALGPAVRPPCTPVGDEGGLASCTVPGRDPQGRTTVVVAAPGNGAQAVVTTLDPAVGRLIVDSARLVTAFGGCDVRPDVLGASAPARAGASAALVPGTPVSATVCRWSGGLLDSAAPLPQDELAEAVATWNSLEPGLGRSRTVATCDDGRAVRIRFRYADGPPLDLWVRWTGCGSVLGFDNGARTGFPTAEAYKLALGPVGFESGLPDVVR